MPGEIDVEKYVGSGGIQCPHCDDYDIEGGFVEIDAGLANQKVRCNTCGSTWIDCYMLTSIEDFEHGDILDEE